MSIEILLLIVVIVIIMACVSYWYVRRVRSVSSSPYQSSKTQSILTSLVQARPKTDPFLQQVASDKARIDKNTITSIQQHEYELEQRFADDARYVKLREQVSQFARVNELDKALIALWEEIEHYPAWSNQEDLDKWNKLDLTGIKGTSEGDISSVEFICDSRRYKVKKRVRSGLGDLNAEISFYEEDDEVFAVDCLVNFENEKTSHNCQRILAFKRRGNWPRVLLEHYAQLKIEKNNSLSEVKYFCTAEIKSRFE